MTRCRVARATDCLHTIRAVHNKGDHRDAGAVRLDEPPAVLDSAESVEIAIVKIDPEPHFPGLRARSLGTPRHDIGR